MPKTAPVLASVQSEDYAPLSEIVSDDYHAHHYNSSPTDAIFPGEPIPKTAGSGAMVYLAQSLILPGEWKTLVRNWKARFPCNFSANIKDGDEVYWDITNEVVSLAADVTNGFSLGYATFDVEPGEAITAADNDRPVVATSTSTEVVVISSRGLTTLKGSASAMEAPAVSAKKS